MSMSDFVILTDSSADLGADLVQQLDVRVLPLSFTIQDHVYHNYPDNREMEPHAFYEMLRAGEVATTSAVNVAQYTEALEPLLQEGRDVLVLAFSSGLSATYSSSVIAVEDLRENTRIESCTPWILCVPLWGRGCLFIWPPSSAPRASPSRRFGTGQRPTS